MADRVTQLPAEVVVLPTSGADRVTQVATEAVVLPTTELSRVTQLAVEVIVLPGGVAFYGEPGGGVW